MRSSVQRALLGTIFLAAAFVLSSDVCRAARPDTDAGRAAEQVSAFVEVTSTTTGEPISRGTGFVVGRQGDELLILTADHVVEEARESRDVRIRVRLRDGSAWLDGTLLPRPNAEDDELDIAVIAALCGQDRFACSLEPSRLAVAASPAARDEVWAYGREAAGQFLEWRRGSVATLDGSRLLFDAEGIVEGCSGGPLLNAFGVVGVVTRRGSGGRGHEAVSIDAAMARLVAAGLPVGVSSDAVGQALNKSLERGLVVGVHTVAERAKGRNGGWGAIEIESRDGDVFSGTLITYSSRAPVQIRRSGAGWTLALGSQQTHFTLNRGPLMRISGNIELAPDENVQIPGILTLRGESDQVTVRLGIPTDSAELLGARLVAEAGRMLAKPSAWQNMHEVSLPADIRVNGQVEPMSLLLAPGVLGIEIPIDPARLRGGGMHIRGTIVSRDTVTNHGAMKPKIRDDGVTAWENASLELVDDPSSTTPLARDSLARRGGRGQLSLSLDHRRIIQQRKLYLRLSGPGIERAKDAALQRTAPFLSQAVIEYR
jgi:hypothetical protein